MVKKNLRPHWHGFANFPQQPPTQADRKGSNGPLPKPDQQRVASRMEEI